jgi:hypothetical protein
LRQLDREVGDHEAAGLNAEVAGERGDIRAAAAEAEVDERGRGVREARQIAVGLQRVVGLARNDVEVDRFSVSSAPRL